MHVFPFVSGSTLVGATLLSYQNAGGVAGSQAGPLPPMDAPKGAKGGGVGGQRGGKVPTKLRRHLKMKNEAGSSI